MKKTILKIGILLIGFLLIYVYDYFDKTAANSGGYSGSIPVDFVLNIIWGLVWCLLIFIEILISFLTGKNKESRKINVFLITVGVIILIVYLLMEK